MSMVTAEAIIVVFLFSILTLCTLACTKAASTKQAKIPDSNEASDAPMSGIQKQRASLVGKTLADVLLALSASQEELRFVDEPPGKLRAIEIDSFQNTDASVVIWLLYEGGELLSPKREWPLEKIKNAHVRGLKFTSGADVQRYGDIGLGQWPESR